MVTKVIEISVCYWGTPSDPAPYVVLWTKKEEEYEASFHKHTRAQIDRLAWKIHRRVISQRGEVYPRNSGWSYYPKEK